MLALFTSANWGGISIDFDDGGGVLTFTQSAATDAYSLAVELLAFLETSYPGLWSWSWSRDDSTGGAEVRFEASSGTYDITPNGDAQTILGLGAAYLQVTEFSGVWAGTAATPRGWSVTRWVEDQSGSGIASGAGALRARTPGDGAVTPRVAGSCKWQEVARLTAALSTATNPRQAYVHDTGVDAFRLISVGTVSHRRNGLIWRVSVEARG